MNIVNLSGKIANVNPTEKVVYATICCRTQKGYEYIPVTIFSTEFFLKNFYGGKYINITGHIHINKHNDKYNTEIIVDTMEFCGEITELDKTIQHLNQLDQADNAV